MLDVYPRGGCTHIIIIMLCGDPISTPHSIENSTSFQLVVKCGEKIFAYPAMASIKLETLHFGWNQ